MRGLVVGFQQLGSPRSKARKTARVHTDSRPWKIQKKGAVTKSTTLTMTMHPFQREFPDARPTQWVWRKMLSFQMVLPVAPRTCWACRPVPRCGRVSVTRMVRSHRRPIHWKPPSCHLLRRQGSQLPLRPGNLVSDHPSCTHPAGNQRDSLSDFRTWPLSTPPMPRKCVAR